ncbi:MAG: phage holin family protein [Bdellovibrionales bacterium]|nr:phage holin family protein [Bdellovibrionales bacterium]
MRDISQLLSFNLDYWVLQTIAMAITALLIPKLRITSVFGAFITVVAIAFMNSKIWDAALFFNIPNSISSQALSLFLTNGILFWILVKILPGIEVSGFLPALVAPVVFTICSLLISALLPHVDWMAVLQYIIDILQKLKEYYQSMQAEVQKPEISSVIDTAIRK